MIRWFFIVFIMGVFGILTEWIMFFPAWIFRNVKLSPFWFWMDNSRLSNTTESGYAEDYEIALNGKKENIWRAYSWHMRNRVWNLNDLFKVPKGKVVVTKMIADNLTMNGKKVDQLLGWTPMATLKYWKDGVEGSNVNKGEYISKKHSILGKGYFKYRIGKWKSFRYSECKIVNYLIWRGYRTLKFGTNEKRYAFTIKHNKIREWK